MRTTKKAARSGSRSRPQISSSASEHCHISSKHGLNALAANKYKSSGLGDSDARALGLKPVVSARELCTSFHPVAALKIPYFDFACKPTQFYRIRYLDKLPGFAGQAAKPQRYAQAPGTLNEVYLPPLMDWKAVRDDPAKLIVITEGELKAACAVQRGYNCIGLGGVDVWRSKKQGFDLLPQLAQIQWKGREVWIVFDSDCATNPSVKKARDRLAAKLGAHGANVFGINLPAGPKDDKVGLDDFLIRYKTTKSAAKALDSLEREPLSENFEQLPPISEMAIAEQFTAKHDDRALYCSAFGKWYLWDGRRYAQDDTRRVFDLARDVCREASRQILADAPNENVGKRLVANATSAHTVAAVLKHASADRAHAASPDDFDADHWAINTPGGIVNLRTGELYDPDPVKRCTKITAVAPGGTCPLWRRFLHEATGGDKELMGFLQRVSGYMLTGEISEHAMFFMHGPGGSGKGTFMNTLAWLLGAYATVAPADMFTVTHGTEHPTGLASLRGARLVIASEVEEGSRWAEAKIKSLTGGDSITARYMRQDFFYFCAQLQALY